MTRPIGNTRAANEGLGRRIWFAMGLLIMLTAVFTIYVLSEKQLDRANEQRFQAHQLGHQLRISSDELTRMVRTYVMTGEPRFKAYYQDILDIRNGVIPRPEGYFDAYWDVVLADPQRHSRPQGAGVALLDLIREAGTSGEEISRLEAAKTNSDRLTEIERQAMALAETAGPQAGPARERARQMLHDAAYHQAKAAIMQPINEFFDLMDQRTAAGVRSAANLALLFRVLFIGSALFTIAYVWRLYRRLLNTMGASPEEVQALLLRIGRGDFSTPIPLPAGAGNSILAELGEMQNRLHMMQTARDRAELALQERSERLREAQQLAGLGSWHLDLQTGELLWSDEIFALFEHDPQHFSATYDAFLAAIHPDDRERVNMAYQQSLANRSPYEITHRLLMSDGRIKWVQERGTSDYDAQGKPLRSRGTVQEVTERVQAEEQLRIAATVFDSQEAMLVTDADGLILRVNQAFTRTTGFSEAEVVGHTPKLLQSGRHGPEFYRSMWRDLRRNGRWQCEIWDRRKDGEVYPKWLTISAVKDRRGLVTHYVGTQFDITERKRAEEKINELAYFDQLTGLPNRTLLQDRLQQAMAASARSGRGGGLLLIDLDNFKTLNDTCGHQVGDQLLKEVARDLKAGVRDCDTVARLGGDEFVVLLSELSEDPKTAAGETEAVAEKIRQLLKRYYQLGAVAHQNAASIGAAVFRGQEAGVDELMKQADLAMYRSKAQGRNRLSFFDPAMESVVRERAELEEALRQALEEKQFLLHYQAQVAGDAQITGAEALVRWIHPVRGMVSPASFIPLAEETGLILPLGQWVLETACAQLALWAKQPELSHLTIAVNVSARQFGQPGFVDQVLGALKKSGASPKRLKLELTESLLVDSVQEVIEKMFALKSKGVGFSLDDFGTGYSSLSYLKRLPLDQLKIDQSFVRDVLTDPNDAAIARTVVALADSLAFGVIAEGVETSAQKDFLAAAGCHFYQGYFFGRPMPLAEFEALVCLQ